MALAAFLIGVTLITGVIYGGIYSHRRKSGDDRLGPPAVWAAWVALAMYGLGTREDYRIEEAAFYPLAAAVLWGVATLARAGRRNRPQS